MSVVKSFDCNSIYENVLPHAVFEAQHYVDTDMVSVRNSLHDIAESVRNSKHGKKDPVVNNPELRKVFRHGDTHADLSTMQKVRLNSIYGEFHNKEDSPEA